MNVFQVRKFDGKNWHVIRTYETKQAAIGFAQWLNIEWDIKEVSLDEANSLVGA